jgi:predicted permease
MIWYAGENGTRGSQSFGTYRGLVERSQTFDSIAVMKAWQPTMTGAAEPERFEGQMVSASYFRVLGVPLAMGRDFRAEEDQVHGSKVVIVGDALWRRRFGGDSSVIGRQVTLDDDSYTIVGVMPREFDNVLAPSAEIWTPLRYDASLPGDGREWGHHLRMAGRLRPGVATNQARSELGLIAQTPVAEFPRRPGSSMSHGMVVNSLKDEVTGGVKPALLAILGAVVLVLVIASVNVTNLLLARGAARQGELAMRVALGAGRFRVVRQLITESLLLAVLGGVLGMVVAQFGVRALVGLSPSELPRLGAIRVDVAVLAFGIGISALVGLAVGLIPALQLSGDDLLIGIQQSSRRTVGGRQLTRRTLVVAEVGLALVLLVSCGLLLRSLQRLFAVPLGFNAENLLTMQVEAYSHRYDDDAACHRFFAQALEAVRGVPGVTAAGLTSQLPLGGDNGIADTYRVSFEPLSNAAPAEGDALRYAVTPGYFEMMGIPLRSGRLFDTRDAAGAAVRPVIIGKSFANRVLPGQDPIGRRLRFGGPANRPSDVVVGVVGDVKQASLALSQSDAVYVTAEQWLWADGTLWLAVRGHGDVARLTQDIKNAVWSVDKDQAIVRVATMDHVVAASVTERRFVLILFEAFGIMALVLAGTGIYGVLAGSVTERTREIGVRSALGATRGKIVALVVRQGMWLTSLGLAVGLGVAMVASNAMVTLLFGVSHLDQATYIGVIVLLTAVSLFACSVPAWRAARVDPSITLRAE